MRAHHLPVPVPNVVRTAIQPDFRPDEGEAADGERRNRLQNQRFIVLLLQILIGNRLSIYRICNTIMISVRIDSTMQIVHKFKIKYREQISDCKRPLLKDAHDSEQLLCIPRLEREILWAI